MQINYLVIGAFEFLTSRIIIIANVGRAFFKTILFIFIIIIYIDAPCITNSKNDEKMNHNYVMQHLFI